jgi:phage tail-like protein
VSIELDVPSAYPPAAGGAGVDGSTFRSFGLSMRFAVSFSSGDGIVQLGEWSSCKGLKVDFKSEAVKSGGRYDYEVKLPTQVTYSPVVLERAMERRSSQQLQNWLGKLVATWVNYADAGAAAPNGTLYIELHDVYQDVVAAWSLRNAYPVSWSGPTLDAKGSTVAIETLTLEHQGFLPLSAGLGL